MPTGMRVRAETVIVPLVLAAAGTAVAIYFNDSDEQWLAALVGWTAGWLLSLAAIAGWEAEHGRPVFGRQVPGQPTWRRAEVVALAVVLFVAAMLRVVAIESYPVALHNDEMSCMLEARGFLGPDTALFNVGWYHCPNLGFFLTSLPLRILGPTLLSLRLSSALLGILSLVAVYLVVRRFFGVRSAMLLIVMTATFHWHLHFSRTGFHYMQAISLTAVAVLLFVVAVDRRSPVLFGCAGVVAGIAWQTYYAAWFFPLLLAAWSVARLLSDRVQGKTAVRGLLLSMAFLVITTAPLLAHYVERPRSATARANFVFLFSDHNRQHLATSYGTSDPAQLLAINATRLGKLLVGGTGDTSVQYGLQGRFIDPFLLPLFLAGLVYALTLIRSPGGQLLWIWFLGTMITGGLLTIDAPFSPRLTGVTPIILLYPALLIDRILRIRWITDRRGRRAVAAVVFGAVMVCSTWWNLRTTFVRYPKMSRISSRDFIVRLAADLGNVKTIVNFSEPEKFEHQAYRSLVPGIRGKNISPGEKSVDTYVAVVRAFRPGVLVIMPLGDNRFYSLCDRVGGDPDGTVITSHGLVGFEWCFVE